MERRLAAVLAADVVGYSRLMGVDEDGTFAAIDTFRKNSFTPKVSKHQGRIVKLMGDGALVEFASVVDAVNCAVDLQRSMAERNVDVPENQRFELRIGINLGDLIVDRDDLYGDGVNVAARLEGIAEPGGICVSQTVADHARGRVPFDFEDLGERTLKNIQDPVRVFSVARGPGARPTPLAALRPRKARHRRRMFLATALALVFVVAIALWELALRPEPANAIAFDEKRVLLRPAGPTIAVMPFENLSGDSAQDYLADGLSEDVIVELGRFRDLNILSRKSTSIYRGAAVDIRDAGRALGADFVLEGTIRKAGDRLRITGRLIDAASGAQVWSQAFNESLTAQDLFDVQLRITERVASAVGDSDGAINRIDARMARTKPAEQLSSYECSIYRLEFLYDRAAQERVRACILRVVAQEPDYWRGWAQLAESLRVDVMLFVRLYQGTNREKLERALAAAERAVALNAESPRAHAALANVRLLLGDRDGFYRASETALSLGGDRRLEGELGYWFIWTGRHEFGAALLRRAIALNPNSTQESWYRGLAHYHFVKGEYEAALSAFREGTEPPYWWSVVLELAILTKLGRENEAGAAIEQLYALRPDIKIADVVWLYRRFQRPDADSAKFVEALREAGIPEGNFAPLKMDETL